MSLAKQIMQWWDDELLADYHLSPCPNNRASSLGFPCKRYLYLCRVDWDKLAQPPIHTLAAWARGREGEDMQFNKLAKRFKLTHAQVAFTLMDRNYPKEIAVSGHIDRFIYTDEGVRTLAELKLPAHCDRFENAEGLKHHHNWWYRGYYAQMQTYQIQSNTENGVFISIPMDSYRPVCVDVPLDYGVAEYYWALAEDINEHVRNRDIYPPIDNPVFCLECRARHLCTPDLVFTGQAMTSDPALIRYLKRRAEIKQIKAQANLTELDKEDKAILAMLKEQVAKYGAMLVTEPCSDGSVWQLSLDRGGAFQMKGE